MEHPIQGQVLEVAQELESEERALLGDVEGGKAGRQEAGDQGVRGRPGGRWQAAGAQIQDPQENKGEQGQVGQVDDRFGERSPGMFGEEELAAVGPEVVLETDGDAGRQGHDQEEARVGAEEAGGRAEAGQHRQGQPFGPQGGGGQQRAQDRRDQERRGTAGRRRRGPIPGTAGAMAWGGLPSNSRR